MKVKDLIKALASFDQNMEVKFACSSGDFWGTVTASDVDEVEIGTVAQSDYHGTDKVISPEKLEKMDEEELEEVREVVLLA